LTLQLKHLLLPVVWSWWRQPVSRGKPRACQRWLRPPGGTRAGCSRSRRRRRAWGERMPGSRWQRTGYREAGKLGNPRKEFVGDLSTCYW